MSNENNEDVEGHKIASHLDEAGETEGHIRQMHVDETGDDTEGHVGHRAAHRR
jgi:hypothetical protein